MKRFFNIAILAAGSLLAACGALFIPQDDTPQGEENVPAEPIGLYFAHLWYSEELYAPIFLAKAVNA